MRALNDLHPDDLTNRNQLASDLRAAREHAGMSQADLGKLLGCTKANITVMESRRAWRFTILAAWARALGRQVTLTVAGLEVPDDGDALAAVYASQQPTRPAALDLLTLRRTVNDLSRIRRATMTAEYAAALLDCGPTAVYWWENHPDGASLLAVQRYARAVDCQVTASLVSVAVPVGAVS